MAVLVCTRQFHYVPADVATEEGCSRLASEANRLMGGIDGLVSGLAMPFGGDFRNSFLHPTYPRVH